MNSSPRSGAAAVALLLCALLAACGKQEDANKEYAYVSAPQVSLRDRLAQVYNKVGLVQNGDRVEILEKQKRFARVRSPKGEEGWMEQRYLASQQVFDAFQKMAAENRQSPSQGEALTRAELNMHVEPGRQTEKLYQLKEAEKVQLLKRAVAERPGSLASPRKEGESPQPLVEDWWLVRDKLARTGWVLGRMVDVDLSLEVAQYAEGQRIVAYFVLNEIADDGRNVPQYLVALTEPKDGLPIDFNQVRVFTWNTKRDRYETAYRERKLQGVLPIVTGVQEFEKEGRLPFFTLRTRDEQGAVQERKYKMNGVMVRRVLPPGEKLPGKAAGQRR